MSGSRELGIAEKLTVEADIDDVPVSIGAFVTNILAEELWLATKLPDPRIGRLRPGDGLHLTLDRDGPIVLESTFLRRLGDNTRVDMQRSRVFAVERPIGMQNSQRRAHVRIDLECKVGIRSIAAANGQKMGTGRTVNIGAGGVLFATTMPMLFGEELRLAIALTSRDIVIASGSIVRIEDQVEPRDPADPDRPPKVTSRVAVRFDDITEADQEKITLYILKASRQSRTNGKPGPEPVARGTATEGQAAAHAADLAAASSAIEETTPEATRAEAAAATDA